MKPKPITAYAIVNKKKPVIRPTDVYSEKQVKGGIIKEPDEKIIKVKITAL